MFTDGGWIFWFFVTGMILVLLALVLMRAGAFDGVSASICGIGIILIGVGSACLLGMGISAARGRDLDGRYANSPLKEWFDGLRSGKGRCCSDADGTAVADPDWKSHNGHYRVRVDGEWRDVPDEAVITEPNRAGRTMVWPLRYPVWGTPGDVKTIEHRIEIRCFMPGSMS